MHRRIYERKSSFQIYLFQSLSSPPIMLAVNAFLMFPSFLTPNASVSPSSDSVMPLCFSEVIQIELIYITERLTTSLFGRKISCLCLKREHLMHMSNPLPTLRNYFSVYTFVVHLYQLKHSFSCKEQTSCTHVKYNHHWNISAIKVNLV